MVLISHRKNFIYIKNKKVAGTSVEAYFEKYCLDPLKNHEPTHRINEKITKYGIIGFRNTGNNQNSKYMNHMNASSIRDNIGFKKFNKYFKFCVVRNPYDKMVSLYHHRMSGRINKKSFSQFCMETHCLNISRYKINNKYICNYYIRYENLEDDIEKVCNILNIKFDKNLIPKYKSEYRSKKIPYQDYYNDTIKRIVYEKHKEEFMIFGYKF